jgi:hypothetical protein
MARGLKKGETQTDSSAVRWFIDSVSKAFLADLVIDFARRNAGNEDLDGIELVDAIIAEADPIATARGDEKTVATARKNAMKGASKDDAKRGT